MNSLEKAIVDTCIWFDIFDRPLKTEEVFSYLIDSHNNLENTKIEDVKNAIKSDFIRKIIQEQEGFVFLRSRRDMYEKYSNRSDIILEKWRYANLYINTLKKIPFVKAIAVCNTLAFDAVKEDSDVDLFIITESGRAWSTRFFMTAISDILGWREKEGGALCLSFFIDEKNLDIGKYSIDKDDSYFKYWIGGLVFVYDSGGVCDRFWKSNETYVKTLLKNIKPRVIETKNHEKNGYKHMFLSKINSFYSFVMRWFFCLFSEKFLRSLQERFFITQEVRMAVDGKRVVLGEGVLKFHTNDKRKEYNDEFKKRINEI